MFAGGLWKRNPNWRGRRSLTCDSIALIGQGGFSSGIPFGAHQVFPSAGCGATPTNSRLPPPGNFKMQLLVELFPTFLLSSFDLSVGAAVCGRVPFEPSGWTPM